ncbi:MAG: SMC-Scp complex subunit ScpB [Aureispira sp.]|nr:SMC-Scp complex subunit ScpB [Aureispira sp.]
METLHLHIESLIFSSETPISTQEIQGCLESIFQTKFEKNYIQQQIEILVEKHKTNNTSFYIANIAKGYQFLTREDYHETVGVLLKQKSRKKLTKAALETLSIIAYKQPITKGELEKIRGVSCDYSVHKLLDKELIKIKGRSPDAGRPLLYATSDKFMQHFGLNNLKDLPKLREFKQEENEIGEHLE